MPFGPGGCGVGPGSVLVKPVPRWKCFLEWALTPLAALVYGPKSEGEQPPGLVPRLVALCIVALIAALAWLTTYTRPDPAVQHTHDGQPAVHSR